MYCSQCGKEVKEGAQFCGNCGTQILAAANDTDAVPAPSIANEVPADVAAQKSRMPIIAAGIAGLVIISTLLLFATQCSQTTQQPVQETAQSMQAETSVSSESAFSASSEAASSTPSEVASSAESSSIELNLTPKEEFIASLDGWWVDQETGVYIKHITDGKVREYLDFGNGRYEGGDKTVDVVAERVEEPPAPDMPSSPGWTLRLSGPDNSLVHYLADSDANMMYCAGFDGTAFPAGYIVRMQPSDALANYAASMEGGSKDAPQASPGEVVLTGTVVATTYAQRQSDLGLPASTGFADNYGELVLLQLDSEVQVNGLNGDFQGRSTRPASSVLLGSEWASRAGEHVSIAVAEEDFEWFSDTMGALVSVSVHNNNVREL